jgi:DASS family divalent anion:Na+ symporter
MKNNYLRVAAIILVGVAIWFTPVPTGLKPQAWKLFAIFVTTIFGFILQPFPIGAIAFMSITFTILSGVLKPVEALSGISDATTWIIVSAFLFAKGIIKTGFGRRIAFILMKVMGDSTLKLAYTLTAADFIISPATPSNTARGGGIIFPIARSLALTLGSEPGATSRRAGAFLMVNSFQSCVVTSAMFMTSCAPNPMIVVLAATTLGVTITWGSWALAALVPGLLSLLAVPYVLYKLYPPEITKTPEAKKMAVDELQKMGLMRLEEKIVAVVFVMAILLWATAQFTKINATAVGMLAVSILMLTKVLDWKDVLEEKNAWDAMVWLGGLLGLAAYLDKLGFSKWLGTTLTGMIGGIPWVPTLAIVILFYFYSHYFFAGLSPHIVAMYSVLSLVAIAAGAPPYLVALSMAYVSSLCAGLTHYATGVAPVFFNAGFVEQKDWWRLGFIVSIVNIIIWVGAGSIWWKFLGLW